MVTQRLKFVLGKVENIVVKGENAGYQHFLPFITMFSYTGLLKSVIADNKIKVFNLYLICQFWTLLIQQQKKIECQKCGQIQLLLSDLVEKIVGKEEIARYEQFLLFP